MTTRETTVETVEHESETEAVDESPQQNGQSPKTPKDRGKRHGKGFVYIGLKDCDDALRKIDSHAKAMSIEGFARALGHDAPKGRFNHKIDALKSFGLVEVDAESVRLSALAEDMLYGAGDSAKSKARTTAFLNYAEFKKVFSEFPKGHDNRRADIVNFVKAKLGVVNEIDRFIRLFVESAEFAGLLEGAPNPDAAVIRLRAAPMSGTSATDPAATNMPANEVFSVMPADEVDDCLDAAGLTEFKQRSEVRQRTTGKYSLTVGDGGKITIEINRPIQITVRPENLLADLPKILDAMQQRGLQA